jgi:uncharacterized membrane protein YjjP (DUF1212 family)
MRLRGAHITENREQPDVAPAQLGNQRMTAERPNPVCSGDGALGLVLGCAALLHANGQSTDMTVTAVGRLNDGLGVSSTLVPSWATVMLVDQGPQAGISCAPATPSSINMRRVSAAMRVIDRAEDGPLDEGEVRCGLAAAATERSSSLAEFVVACATGAAALAVIFGETAPVVVAVIAASAALGGFLRRGLARLHLSALVQVFAAAAAAGLVGAGALNLGISDSTGLVAVCPCMVMVPGPHILNGVLDLLSTRITLGAARLLFAGTLLLAIGAGLILGLRIGGQTLSVSTATTGVPFYVDTIAAAVVAGSYAVYFGMPRRMMWWPILVGMLAHGAHWYVVTVIDLDLATAAMGTCILVGIVLVPVSHVCRIPFAAIGFASVVALIPGAYVFRVLSGILQLRGSFSTALLDSTFTDGITAVLVIAGMSLGLAIPKYLYGLQVTTRPRHKPTGA